jgi:5-methylcytosine-specific restriction endonuclease McrA
MDRTLLLNQSYEPVNAISWKRAICLVMLGKAETIEEYEKEVRSARSSFKVPAVVRLVSSFRRHRKRVKFSKQHVFARDRFKCQYCGQRKSVDELTQDHVLPRSRGGKTEWTNIVTACKPCNAEKMDRTPDESGMHPINPPQKPDWVPVFAIKISHDMPEQWKNFVYFSMNSFPERT